jgi:hypothetical protein
MYPPYTVGNHRTSPPPATSSLKRRHPQADHETGSSEDPHFFRPHTQTLLFSEQTSGLVGCVPLSIPVIEKSKTMLSIRFVAPPVESSFKGFSSPVFLTIVTG